MINENKPIRLPFQTLQKPSHGDCWSLVSGGLCIDRYIMSGYTTSAQDEVVADDPALPTLSSKTTVSARQQYWLLSVDLFLLESGADRS